VNGSSTSSQALIPVVSQVQNDSIQNNSVPANTAFTVNTPEPAKQPQAGTKGTTVSNVLTSVFNGGSLGYVPGQSSQIPVVQNDNSDEIFFEENEPQEATPTDLGNPVESISGSLGEITLKSMHPVQRPVLGDVTDHEKLPSQLLIPALNRYLSNSDSVKESSIIPESPDALANHTETDNLGVSETVFVGNMNRNGSVVTEQPLVSADMTTPDVTRESVSTDRLVYDPQELFCIRVVEAPVSGVPSRENSAFPEIPSVSLITTAPLQPAAVAWNFVPNTTEFMNSETGETVDFSDPECGFASTFPDSYRDIGTMSSNMTSVNTAVGYSDSNGNTVVYVDRPEVSDRVPVSAPNYRVAAAPGYWNNNTMDNVITGKDPAVTYSGNWGYSAGENEGFASSGNGITGSVPASGFPVISQSEPVQTDGLAFSDGMMTIPADSPLIAGNSADSGYHLVAAGTDNRPRRSASESIQEAIKAGAKVTELDASEYRKALREAGTQAAATKNQVTQTMK
ncbi:MAG: hypothetical protein IKW74_00645, partial [Thermoguttaceae bacterium]|nr:hypothetical protein [Thermoguttaceae bacterium]